MNYFDTNLHQSIFVVIRAICVKNYKIKKGERLVLPFFAPKNTVKINLLMLFCVNLQVLNLPHKCFR